MIAARHEEVVGVEQLEGEEGEDALDGEGAAVDEVAVEQVRVVFRWNAVLKDELKFLNWSFFSLCPTS